MFEYKVEFGKGVTIKIGSTNEQNAGKLLFLGALGDVQEVKKYMSANGVNMKTESPMNICSTLKGWDWEWSVVSSWASATPASSSEEESEEEKPKSW